MSKKNYDAWVAQNIKTKEFYPLTIDVTRQGCRDNVCIEDGVIDVNNIKIVKVKFVIVQ